MLLSPKPSEEYAIKQESESHRNIILISYSIIIIYTITQYNFMSSHFLYFYAAIYNLHPYMCLYLYVHVYMHI